VGGHILALNHGQGAKTLDRAHGFQPFEEPEQPIRGRIQGIAFNTHGKLREKISGGPESNNPYARLSGV
jgi:hypothetical protein